MPHVTQWLGRSTLERDEMSQAGNDSNNVTKFKSNIINVRFPGQMAINEYSKIFYIFFAFERGECFSIDIYYI